MNNFNQQFVSEKLFKWQRKSIDKDIGGSIDSICPYCGGKKEFYGRGYCDNTIQKVECLFCGWSGFRSIVYKSSSYRKCRFETSIIKYLDIYKSENTENISIKIDNDMLDCKKTDNKKYYLIFNDRNIKEITALYIDRNTQTIKFVFDNDIKIKLNLSMAHKLFKFFDIYANDNYDIYDALT